jgi:entry exclusion lipoprotein TrbK
MKTMHILVLAALVPALLTGCNEKPAVAGETCADLNKITDAAARAELLKKCPRSGPDFKPSKPGNW